MELVSLYGGSVPRKGIGDLTQDSDQSIESGCWGRWQPHTLQVWMAWIPWVVGDSGMISKLWHHLSLRRHPPACRERWLFIAQLCPTLRPHGLQDGGALGIRGPALWFGWGWILLPSLSLAPQGTLTWCLSSLHLPSFFLGSPNTARAVA